MACPFCGESIAAAARKCRFCGEWLQPPEPSDPSAAQGQPQGAAIVAAPVDEPVSEKPADEPADVSRSTPRRAWIVPLAAIAIGGVLLLPWAAEPEDAVWYRLLLAVIEALLFLFVVAPLMWLATRFSRRAREKWSFGRVVRSKLVAGITALLCLLGAMGQRQADVDEGTHSAVRTGVVAAGSTVSPVERCVGLVLDDDRAAEVIPLLPEGVTLRTFSRRLCEFADAAGSLDASGFIASSDEFARASCVEVGMMGFETLPVSRRRFSYADFQEFMRRYCGEAIAQNLADASNTAAGQAKLKKLQTRILNDMLARGEITDLS